MWICLNDGFVSIVADRGNKDRLLVRARREQDLKNFLPEFRHDAIFKDEAADYRWRAFVNRLEVNAIVALRIGNIEYDNFKNSVKDNDLRALYGSMWQLHYSYQKHDWTHRTPKDTGWNQDGF